MLYHPKRQPATGTASSIHRLTFADTIGYATCILLPLLQNARNVLVVSNGASACGMTAKVADLGLSRSIKQNSHRTTNTVGTMNHTAPGAGSVGRRAPWHGTPAAGDAVQRKQKRESSRSRSM